MKIKLKYIIQNMHCTNTVNIIFISNFYYVDLLFK